VFLPTIYTSHTFYLTEHPVVLGIPLATFIFVLGALCIWINYDCDRQRVAFRRANGKLQIWGKPAQYIAAEYQTDKGMRKSVLLYSGWWGLARHFHYVPEILASFFWSVPALFDNFMPYFYVIYLTLLLTDRAHRDDARCKSKYGKFWDMYCEQVPYKIVPFLI
jgi:7-dehydrocholesterol reductase